MAYCLNTFSWDASFGFGNDDFTLHFLQGMYTNSEETNVIDQRVLIQKKERTVHLKQIEACFD
jgi:hypothetical protein